MSLLEIKYIKKELIRQIDQFNLCNIQVKNNKIKYYFKNEYHDKMILIIKDNLITIFKYREDQFERTTINESLIVNHSIIEKRENGMIYTNIQKYYTSSEKYNTIVLENLVEKRYLFTSKEIENIIKKKNYEKITPIDLMIKLNKLTLDNNHLSTKFSTHMNYYYRCDSYRKNDIKQYCCSNKTFFNNKDISYLYDSIKGEDVLLRIYDLYNGVINERNEYDIRSIYYGLLSIECFDLKELYGIKLNEEKLIGSLNKQNEINYLKRLKKLL